MGVANLNDLCIVECEVIKLYCRKLAELNNSNYLIYLAAILLTSVTAYMYLHGYSQQSRLYIANYDFYVYHQNTAR